MEPGSTAVIRVLFLILFAGSVPVAIAGVLSRNDLQLAAGIGMGLVALYLRRYLRQR